MREASFTIIRPRVAIHPQDHPTYQATPKQGAARMRGRKRRGERRGKGSTPSPEDSTARSSLPYFNSSNPSSSINKQGRHPGGRLRPRQDNRLLSVIKQGSTQGGHHGGTRGHQAHRLLGLIQQRNPKGRQTRRARAHGLLGRLQQGTTQGTKDTTPPSHRDHQPRGGREPGRRQGRRKGKGWERGRDTERRQRQDRRREMKRGQRGWQMDRKRKNIRISEIWEF